MCSFRYYEINELYIPMRLPYVFFSGRNLDIGGGRRNMQKKIAVLVRDRQAEALRMAVGLTLENDEVTVFIMDIKLEDNEAVALNIETLNELNVKIYSNNPLNNFEQMSTENISSVLLNYDSVIPY
jgi:hypothetical protein